MNTFETQNIILKSGSVLYLSSDGMEDQNNLKRKKFSFKRIKNILEYQAQSSLEVQKNSLEETLDDYAQDVSQRDDILFLGVVV